MFYGYKLNINSKWGEILYKIKLGDTVFSEEYGEGIVIELGEGCIEREFIEVAFEYGVVRLHNSYVRKL